MTPTSYNNIIRYSPDFLFASASGEVRKRVPIINIKKRKTDSEKQQIVLDLVLMDDAMFESMCQSPEFVEELLQTILNDSKLHIKSETLMAQKSIRNLRGRSIRMDAYVEGQEGNAFNVEMQKSDNCNHVKRVRYNASLITAQRTEPGDTFEDVQSLCMIYISEKDIFHKQRTLYHVQNTIIETGDLVDNGLKEIYVNTEVQDNTRLAALMGLFHKKELDNLDKEMFPNTYTQFTRLKNDNREVARMCDKIQNYAKKEAIYSAIEIYDEEFALDRKEIISKIMKRFKITSQEAESYYDDVFITK